MAIVRIPEDDLVMDSEEAVAAFDQAGRPSGALWPVYHVNASHLSARLPRGGRVLDLFCGSGRLLRHLLPGRADLRAIGLDLSPPMLAQARAGLDELGVGDRVELLQGDAARAHELVTGPVDAITSLSALHHCPTHEVLVDVLRSVRHLRERTGCAIWLFDLIRPDDEDLLELLPRAHEISAREKLPPIFKRDWTLSLRAGWTVDEFRTALDTAGLALTTLEGNHSQLHWCEPAEPPSEALAWSGPVPAEDDLARAQTLAEALGLPALL